ncbi:MAG: O-antigen ligase family protein [Anaerolineae bacterium]|nr:O-antigen ligase family protein [Anaerolineae bacterium]
MISIALVGLGVVWQNMFPSSPWGWVGMFAGLVLGIATQQIRPARTPLDGPALLLVLMGGVSLWATAFPEVTWAQVARLWSGLIGAYAVLWWANGRAKLTWLAYGLVAAGVAIALLSFVTVRWSQTKLFLIPDSFYALFPLLVSDAVHPNIMASVMILLLPLPLALFASSLTEAKQSVRYRPLLRVGLVVAVLLMGGVLLLTKSRGGYLAAAVGVLALLWLSGRWKLALVMLLVCVVVGVWAVGYGSDAGTASDLVEQSADPATLAFRLNVWRVALWMMDDFPFTGTGMGTFNDVGALLYPFYETQNPGTHNVYLQAGVDLGLPGLIAYLALLGLVLWMAWQAVRRFKETGQLVLRGIAIGALSGMIALLVHGLVDNTMWNTRAAFLPWLVMGMLVALHRCAQETSDNPCEGSKSVPAK